MITFEGFTPLSEQFDCRSGLWCTEHQREDGQRFVIARPIYATVFATAAGSTRREAIANWQRRVAPTFARGLAA